jgi:hypothetical protein
MSMIADITERGATELSRELRDPRSRFPTIDAHPVAIGVGGAGVLIAAAATAAWDEAATR